MLYKNGERAGHKLITKAENMLKACELVEPTMKQTDRGTKIC